MYLPLDQHSFKLFNNLVNKIFMNKKKNYDLSLGVLLVSYRMIEL